MPFSNERIRVGARSSPLARIQVGEVLSELNAFYPNISFDTLFVETSGDIDLKTSLRALDKTDFFTKEIDELILGGQCRIGIHSAKDLPHPLPAGLRLICLTKGIDSSDSLVLRPGSTIENLPPHARIATSSVRREECVKELRNDFVFIDIRGTIGQRLEQLDRLEADGVVIAEAALIRLNLTHLNRVRLPGPTAEGQGQLAVIAKEYDEEMAKLFSYLNLETAIEQK